MSKLKNPPTAESVWKEYERMLDYNASIQLDDTVRVNENFFVGRQWEGVESNGLPTPVFNFLKRVTLFTVASITSERIKLRATPVDAASGSGRLIRAADVVNEYSKEELTRILRDYGEERFAGKIAEKIVKAREDHRIETTDELVELIKAAIPVKMRTGGGHPAKRTFQAIRIEVNQELQVLQDSIDTMIGLLKPGGRLAIITFHSLEDRIVKNGFRTNEHPCICPPDFPVCVCGRKSRGTVVTKKPVVPSTEELAENHRSKSAKLRVFQRAEDET